jgi:hypothetical protein
MKVRGTFNGVSPLEMSRTLEKESSGEGDSFFILYV